MLVIFAEAAALGLQSKVIHAICISKVGLTSLNFKKKPIDIRLVYCVGICLGVLDLGYYMRSIKRKQPQLGYT